MNSSEIGLADDCGQDVNDLGVLIGKMKSTNSTSRKNAIEILMKYGDLRAVEPLIKLLKNKNTKIRIATVKILIELQDVRAIEPLIKELGIEDLEISKAAVKALEECDGKSVDYEQMNFQKLKQKLKGCKFWSIHGLKTSGGKAELIARLNEELRYQQQAYFKNIRAIEGVLPRSRRRYGKSRDDRIYLNWISFRVQEIFKIQSCDSDWDHPMEDKPIGHGPRPVFFFYEFNDTINSLSEIDDVQVVRILMRLFYNIELYDQERRRWEINPFVYNSHSKEYKAFEPVIDAATEVLKNITDARAIRLFEEAKNGSERSGLWRILSKVATEILKKTKFVETPISQFYEKIILISLPYLQKGKRIEWGVPAVGPLIKALEDERLHALEALVELTKELIQTKEKENILRFLESGKPDIIRMGASLLKGVAEK